MENLLLRTNLYPGIASDLNEWLDFVQVSVIPKMVNPQPFNNSLILSIFFTRLWIFSSPIHNKSLQLFKKSAADTTDSNLPLLTDIIREWIQRNPQPQPNIDTNITTVIINKIM
jgi:hypothetical protein